MLDELGADNNVVYNYKPIPDITAAVSSHDMLVQIVTHNYSHVHDSKEIDTHTTLSNEANQPNTPIVGSLNCCWLTHHCVDVLGSGMVVSNPVTLAFDAVTVGC